MPALAQLGLLSLCLCSAAVSQAVAPLRLADGTEFIVEQHAASSAAASGRLLIWLPSEAGPQANDAMIAADLARQGIEVWRVDPLEARFLPTAQSSMDLIPAADIAALLDHALRETDKQVFFAGTDRAVIPILRGLQLWQRQQTEAARQQRLGGAILISPKFFVETPDPGEAAQLMPIVTQTNLPLYLLQPKQSPWFWKLPSTRPALEQSGSSVYVHTVAGIRDRFYFRPDATAQEQQQTQQLPHWLAQATRLLAALPAEPRRLPVPQTTAVPSVRLGKKDRVLQDYQGDSTPPPLRLADLQGKAVDLTAFRGKVVLVNFWASWCPPCVYEMPSMQRLQDRYRQQGFVILGVNMAEEPAAIAEFLATRVRIDFPILLDRDGAALRRWQVFAFPTSYVIDREQRIRYALFGGLEWDTPEIMQKIEALLAEKP
ncbi:MAG: TlpA disulfide reductase family protein [Gammaproteobacteria bacterium]